ncbi:hypothetical protein [Pelosinus propionicus]|uniref:Uncharacterized protein n=1 Tax=Pelosinus propionicus DSM 13327 TaxID=1123291 RepID=A0A1I4N881_9FIRM|nr:hypothetical protein [Pelosinus propionicus]SFM11507.1 hypothetical protein SAMN04490355_10428 [Pelosinus propionicus DSM 13327]
MIHSDLNIQFIAKPCTNFKVYYYDYTNSKTLLGAPAIYLSDKENLSDLPSNIAAEFVNISWEYTGEENCKVTDSEIQKAIADLINYYKLGNNLTIGKNVNLEPLFDFASTYGMIAEKWINHDAKNCSSLNLLIDHINTAMIISDIMSKNIKDKVTFPSIYNNLVNAVKNYTSCKKDSTYYCLFQNNRMVVAGTKELDIEKLGLYFTFPVTMQMLKYIREEYEEAEDTHEPYDMFIDDLRISAVQSIVRNIERKIKLKTVTDGAKIHFIGIINSPTAYQLLCLKPNTSKYDKKEYQREYCKKTYPKLSSYFRSKYYNQKISKEQYEKALELAKVECNDAKKTNSYPKYESIKKYILQEIGGK